MADGLVTGMSVADVQIDAAEGGAVSPPVARPRAAAAGWPAVRVCSITPVTGAMACVEWVRGRAEPVVYSTEDSTQTIDIAKAPRRCVTIALLPRSLYLTRVVEVPAASAADTRQMLRLDVEAQFPPEFGDVELSYRRLGEGQARGSVRYEVYIVRRTRLGEFTAALSATGMAPDYYLPTAVVWHALLERGPGAPPLIAAEWRAGQIEAAARQEDGSLVIRGLSASAEQPRELVEYIRTQMKTAGADGRRVVGWIGGHPPLNGTSGVVFEEAAPAPAGPPLLCAAGAVLLGMGRGEFLDTANLLPLDVVAAGERKRAVRSAVIAGVMLSVGVALMLAGLRVSTMRYQARRDALEAKISTIRTQGQLIGSQIEQLRVVGLARTTRDDFANIMSGLLEATPAGVSYSQVDLDKDRAVVLRGQAESLSLPFLLPEKLEATPVFKEAVLRDAGQLNQGQGSIVEFRLETRLKGGPKP